MSAPFFASVGLGNIVCANRVLAVITPRSKTAKEFIKAAKAAGTYLDVTMGKTIKSLVLFDNGFVLLSHITTTTLRYRFSNLHRPKPWKSSEEFNEEVLGDDDSSVLIDDEEEEDEEDEAENEFYGVGIPERDKFVDDDEEVVHELP